MKKADSRTLSIDALNERRRLAVRLRLGGMKIADIAAQTDLSAPTVIAAHKAYAAGGWVAVPVKPRGRNPGAGLSLAADRQADLQEAICTLAPEHIQPETWLWQAATVRQLIEQRYGLTMPLRSVDRYLKRWGFTAERTTELPILAENAETRRWLKAVYPTIIERARQEHAETQWLSESALRREGSSERHSLLCAMTNRGKLRWRVYDGNLKDGAIIDFLDRLSKETGRKLFLIVDGLSLDRAAALQEWLTIRRDDFELFSMPQANAPVKRGTASARPEAPNIKHLTATTTNDRTEKFPGHNLGATMSLTHLQRLEAESIHIMREVVSETDNPVMLYSIGKDSAVMLHLAMKAFYPAKPPFPLLHVDTTWKFQDMYKFRDEMAKKVGMDLLVYTNPEAVEKNINPFTHGSQIHTDIWKTQGLKQALDKYGFDAAFGGARRDEEKSRAKERIFSFRTAQHRWDPKNQRPELWRLYNARKHKGESIRVFPISNWTELDIWQYIHLENIPIVPLYFSAERPVVERDGTLIMVDDDRMPLNPGEVPMMRKVRFRTLGCYPLTGAVESEADKLTDIIQEMLLTKTSERQGRMIDHDTAASMEKKKQEGYF